jgi:hypothetical protein
MKRTILSAILLLVLFAQTFNSQTSTEVAEEEFYFEALKPTITKWLGGEKIKAGFQGAPANRFQPYLVDVNGDGNKELAVRNGCAPAGNCQFWLFKKARKSYEIILKSLPGSVQTFEFKKTKTNGYFDLVTKVHADAWSGGIEVYRFNGKKYVVSECSTYSYSFLKYGKLYELKKPQIISVKCTD